MHERVNKLIMKRSRGRITAPEKDELIELLLKLLSQAKDVVDAIP